MSSMSHLGFVSALDLEDIEACGEALIHTCMYNPRGVCYFIMEIVARGGQALIFMAYMAGGVKVALKISPCEADHQPPRSYLQELHTLETCQNQPGFMTLFDDFIFDQRYAVLVLPLYAAGTWQKYGVPQDNITEWRERAQWLFQRLQYLHETLHCCHGDIKPPNIMIHENGHWALGDFGFSVPLAAPDPLRSAGTWDYMPPEIHEAKRWIGGPDHLSDAEIRQKRDVWCAGITLWELLVGQPPFAHLSVGDTKDALVSGSLPWTQIKHVEAKDFLRFILTPTVSQRPTATQVLAHPFLFLRSVGSKRTA